MSKEVSDPRLDRARARAAAGDWDAAAQGYGEVARDLEARGRPAEAHQALMLAGDALRRADRPAGAARRLEEARALLPEHDPGLAPRRAMVDIQLAGVLVEVGALGAADNAARQALVRASTPGLQTLALDTLIGITVVRGDLAEAAELLEELARVAPEGARVALDFRRAVQARLLGELERSRALLLHLRAGAAVEAQPGMGAAVLLELGEVALQRGDDAQPIFAEAGELAASAGRRVPVFRALAGGVRAALANGATPLAAELQEAMAFTRGRQLVLLEAELLLTSGWAWQRSRVRGAEAAFDQAVSLAESCGATLLEGRARLTRRQCGFLRADLERTRALLPPGMRHLVPQA